MPHGRSILGKPVYSKRNCWLSEVEPKEAPAYRCRMAKTKAAALRVLFGRRLRELRKEQGLSLEALGERSGVDDKYIQSVETAKQAATVDTIEKLATGLGVLPKDLFAFSDELPMETRDRIDRLLAVAGDGDLKKIARVVEALVGG